MGLALAATCGTWNGWHSPVQAQAPAGDFVPRAADTGGLQPVPKFSGSSLRDPSRDPQRPQTSNQLVWRKSEQVSPAASSVSRADARAERSAGAASHGVRQTQFELPAPAAPSQAAPSQAAPGQPGGQSQPLAPPTTPDLGLPPTLRPADPPNGQPLPDFFADPFGDTPVPAPRTAPTSPTETLPAIPELPSMPQLSDPRQPATDPRQPAIEPPNALRGDDAPTPLIPPVTPPAPQTEPSVPPATTPALPDPVQIPLFPDLPETSPSDRTDRPDRSPIDRAVEEWDTLRPDSSRRTQPPPRAFGERTEVRPVSFSCDDFRTSIRQATIQTISLDISPPFRPDVIEMDEFDKLRSRFLERQEIREWTSIDGRKLGRGRLHDLAYERVIIETEFGTREELPISRIGEADLAYVASQWGLPQECLIEQRAYQPRRWINSKITWKASNLMHTPLYFEEVNLERYGHTAGPILQPVVSSAHFFANIAVLPYKVGVHLPHECQYPLGYYRPGDCAPWITPPIPLSLRGALFQVGGVAATVALVP